MAIQTAAMKNILSNAYKGAATYAALFTSAPTGGVYPTAGTEPSGGSPAYARILISWGSSSSGVVSGTATFNVPTGVTIQGAGLFDAVTAGTYYDGVQVTSQAFASQGTYALTVTFTET
jgi:hypothetical protein